MFFDHSGSYSRNANKISELISGNFCSKVRQLLILARALTFSRAFLHTDFIQTSELRLLSMNKPRISLPLLHNLDGPLRFYLVDLGNQLIYIFQDLEPYDSKKNHLRIIANLMHYVILLRVSYY